MKLRSIRIRLLGSVVAIQIVGAVIATYLVVEHERHQSYLAFDANLGEQAAVLRSLIEAPEESNDTIVFHREFLSIPKDNRFFLTDDKGEELGGSAGWPMIHPLPRDLRAVVNVDVAGRRFRALVLQKLPVVDPEAQPTSVSPTVTLVYAAPTDPVEAHIQRVELQSLFACIALLATSKLVTVWALSLGLRPLRELASGAEKIDVGRWEMPELEQSKTYSELRPLANALTGLVDRLHSAFNRERQFFGDAAHEMKSSTAIVRSTLQFALQAKRSAEEYQAELRGALNDTDRLHDLVSSMLVLARIESIGPPSTGTAAAEVHAQAGRVTDRFRSLAGQKRITLVVQSAEHAIWVAMSEENLFTVLSNLVENAVAYSDSGKQITISIRTANGSCLLDVKDEGCGIRRAALPYIFDRFYRADDSRTRATGGAGLGLSIVKALVVQANGVISVQSEVGKGTMFSIFLPRLEPPLLMR